MAGFYCRGDVEGNGGSALARNFLEQRVLESSGALGVDSIPERFRQLGFDTPWKRESIALELLSTDFESAPV